MGLSEVKIEGLVLGGNQVISRGAALLGQDMGLIREISKKNAWSERRARNKIFLAKSAIEGSAQSRADWLHSMKETVERAIANYNAVASDGPRDMALPRIRQVQSYNGELSNKINSREKTLRKQLKADDK